MAARTQWQFPLAGSEEDIFHTALVFLLDILRSRYNPKHLGAYGFLRFVVYRRLQDWAQTESGWRRDSRKSKREYRYAPVRFNHQLGLVNGETPNPDALELRRAANPDSTDSILHHQIHKALAALKQKQPRDCAIVISCYVGDRSFRDLAEEYRLSEGRIRQLRDRGTNFLRTYLKKRNIGFKDVE